jgi:hypothetical protein
VVCQLSIRNPGLSGAEVRGGGDLRERRVT